MSTPSRPAGSAGALSASTRPGALARALMAVLRWYGDAVSPALPPRCRFYPSCSTYAVTAVARHGAARGGWLGVRRILRCGPWHPGGVDHVPSIYDGEDRGDELDRAPCLGAPPKSVGPQRLSVSQESAVV